MSDESDNKPEINKIPGEDVDIAVLHVSKNIDPVYVGRNVAERIFLLSQKIDMENARLKGYQTFGPNSYASGHTNGLIDAYNDEIVFLKRLAYGGVKDE